MRIFRFAAVTALAFLIVAGSIAIAQVNQVPGPGLNGYDGAKIVGWGFNSSLNIAAATVVKTGRGRVACASIIVLGSTAGSIADTTTTGAVATANKVLVIPASAAIGTTYCINFPVTNGIVVTPGTSGVIALSYQ